MPIRWKLILGVGGPLVALLAALLVFDFFRLKEEAFATARERTAELAQRYAAGLDADCRAIAQVSLATARFLAVHPNPTEAELYEMLRLHVESNPLIYGSCVAFEPGTYERDAPGGEPSALPVAPGPRPRPNPALFCPYVFRGGPTGMQRMDVADAYDYLDPRWHWYGVPRRTGQPFWTEPFFDEGAGNARMVTYAAPLILNGKFRGTVNVDVLLDDLRDRTIAGLPRGTDVYILSREGAFIVAPAPELVMAGPAARIAESTGHPEALAVVERMLAGRHGAESIDGAGRDGRQVVFFASVQSPGWSLAGAASEATIMWPVYAALWVRVAVMLGAITGVVGVTLGMGVWIVRPVGRLSDAVSALSAGNLNARVTGIRARDEIGQLARAYNGMLERLQGHVDALRRETAVRESVERELGVARAIQLSLLPREFPEPPGCRVFAVSSPARQVGGDFFDVFTGEGGVLTVVVADVSGKGVPAALFMAVTRTMIRDLAATRAGSPAAMLMRANERLREENTEGMFVTMFLAQYDPRTGAVRYANAGHPHPYVVDSHGSVRTFGRSTGTVVGVLPDQEFEDREERLEPGERLLVYTDGVTEARGHEAEFFGTKRLEELLRSGRGQGARALCEATVRAVDAFQSNGRADDVTVMVLERLA